MLGELAHTTRATQHVGFLAENKCFANCDSIPLTERMVQTGVKVMSLDIILRVKAVDIVGPLSYSLRE